LTETSERVSLDRLTAEGQKMARDEEHLQLLSIFHYVVSGLTALFALFPILHLVLGLFLILTPETLAGKGHDQPSPALIGWFFVIFAITFIAIGWLFAVFILTAGRFLARRKHYTFCLVMAGIECIIMPFGTVLGVLTLVVLLREPVKQMFQVVSPATTTGMQS
jgi:hypothetical protein